MKFTDEELSRILSAHEADVMRAGGGGVTTHCCCLFQASTPGIKPAGAYRVAACKGLRGLVQKFDARYNPFWTPEEFIAWLESQGAA